MSGYVAFHTASLSEDIKARVSSFEMGDFFLLFSVFTFTIPELSDRELSASSGIIGTLAARW